MEKLHFVETLSIEDFMGHKTKRVKCDWSVDGESLLISVC